MSHDTAVNFVVPTGNFGNILAGYYAKKMGLPIDKLICASNENKVLFDYFDTGVFDSNRPFYLTASPSMDILVPSNFERLVHDLVKPENGQQEMLKSLSAKQKFTMDVPRDFLGFHATEKEVAAAIKKVFTRENYLIDPHTAVAYVAHEKFGTGKNIIISTASPYKFAKTVMTAIDEKYAAYDDFALLEQMADLTKSYVPPQFADLKNKEIRHTKVVDISQMQDAVLDFVNS
jgi:threonine synthase